MYIDHYPHHSKLAYAQARLPHESTLVFFFNDTATTEIYPLSLHDALPISEATVSIAITASMSWPPWPPSASAIVIPSSPRSEEHTSELQSPCNLVCRLLLEKKKRETGGKPNVTR